MLKNIVSFVGSNRPTKVQFMTAMIAVALEQDKDVTVLHRDLSGMPASFFSSGRAELDGQSLQLVNDIENSDGLVVGCPVYQGSYPGMFKHVFDLIHPLALKGKPVILCAVGGGQRHALMVEHHLRPLFGFFEANVVATGIYACATDFGPDGAMPVALTNRIDSAIGQMQALLTHYHGAPIIRWQDVEFLEHF